MLPENIMFFLYLASRRRFVLPSVFLRLLVERLNTFPADETSRVISAHALRKGFYGLRCYSTRYPSEMNSAGIDNRWKSKKIPNEVLQYVEYMTSLLLSYPHRLTGETVTLVLYGVQGLGSQEEEVRRLLHVVYHKLERHSKHSAFTAMELSQCFYGLKNMCQNDVEVLRLLRVLTMELDLLQEPMTPVQLANCFYGLNRMSSHSHEVRRLLASLARSLDSCQEPFNCRQINNILYGMQGMLGREPEVASCINAIASVVERSVYHIGAYDMSSQDIALMGYGMKEMSSRHSEVRRLVASLTKLITQSCNVRPVQDIDSNVGTIGKGQVCFESGLLEPRAMGTCLLGLKNMSSDYEEVCGFVDVVHKKMQQGMKSNLVDHTLWRGRWISNGLLGLRNMSTSNEVVLRMVSFLIDQLKISVENGVNISGIEAVLALSGLQSVENEHLPLRRRAVKLLVSELVRTHHHSFVFPSYRDTSLIVQCCRGLPNLSLDHNETQLLLKWLHGQLKADATVGTLNTLNNTLNIDTIRNITLGLGGLVPGDGHNTIFEYDHVIAIWQILCDHLESLVLNANPVFPSQSLCFYAFCDLVRSIDGLSKSSSSMTICSEKKMELDVLIERLSKASANGFHLLNGRSSLDQHKGYPLNWIMQAICSLEHVIRHSLSLEVIELLAALEALLYDAGPCVEHPPAKSPLRLGSVEKTFSILENLLSQRNDDNSVTPDNFDILRPGCGAPENLEFFKSLLSSLMDKIQPSLEQDFKIDDSINDIRPSHVEETHKLLSTLSRISKMLLDESHATVNNQALVDKLQKFSTVLGEKC